MFRFGHFLWVSLCKFMLNIFWFIEEYIRRVKTEHKSVQNGSNFNVNHPQEDDGLDSQSSMGFDSGVAAENETSNFSFKLMIQESKDSKENIAETEDSTFLKSGFSANSLKYQFMAGKNVMGFMEEPETMSFTIQEMFVESNDGLIKPEDEIKRNSEEEIQEFDTCSNASNSDGSFVESGFCNSDDLEESTMEEETPVRERADSSLKTPSNEQILENKEAENSDQNAIISDEEMDDDDISYELQLFPTNEFSTSDLKPELENSCDGSFIGNQEVESGITEVVLSSDAKYDEFLPEVTERILVEKEVISSNLCTIKELNVNEGRQEDIDDEYIELEPSSKDANEVNEKIVSQKDENLFEDAYTGENGTELMDGSSQGFEQESLVKESRKSDSDDEDEFDILLEHQELVKQMKMEMKNSKVRGLPTISEDEECETPKIVEDLKPLKIDDKFEYKGLMEEIHKFHKSYAEKMRKLDILNYQTLHAISFLQLNDSQLFMPSKKSLLSSIKPFSLPNILLFKERRIFADPTLKSITEMHRHLELVYVGQICLSWEILQWEYGKLKELLEHDSEDHLSYNQIAGEYQQFQVLLQRFVEDERFNGPRIQNFVKSRCFCRGLLQVPIIRDDCTKDKKETIVDEKDVMSISMLADTIKESMQIFWEFLRADKEEANGVRKTFQGSPVDSQADTELLMNVRTCLEKKERKIKDIQRSGNCIVKKFQKHQANQPYNTLLISQVELKLVTRVLSLSRLTTDHLVWCQKKLNNINIVNRKVRVEPAFLLFPC
ncbi:hypothetical protein ACH5RR_035859 [Cinchona calisaya]|uniref:Ribosomal protein L34Ae n=1 Tax=Cinchona calisaya TaxID=153742 RepID=A0ABD2Y3N1_9GENT